MDGPDRSHPCLQRHHRQTLCGRLNEKARSIRAAGGSRSETIHIAYTYGLFTGGPGAHFGAEHLGAAVIPVGGGFTDRQGIDAQKSSLRLGILGAEPWGEGMVAQECSDSKGALTIWETTSTPRSSIRTRDGLSVTANRGNWSSPP
jgi:phenylacetate-coenzyme A ligase PaaK-like adenylate-forming protein